MKKKLYILAIALIAIQHIKAQDNPLIFTRPGAIDSIVNQKGNLLKLDSRVAKPMLHVNGQLQPYKYLSNIPAKDISKLTYYARTESTPYYRLLPNGGSLIALQLLNKTPQNGPHGMTTGNAKAPAAAKTVYEKSPYYINDSSPKQQIVPEDTTIYLPTEPGLYLVVYRVGGIEQFNKFIADNIKYPQEAKAKKIQGKVKLSFVVEKNGTLTNIKPQTRLGYGLEDEVIRLFRLSPRWTPSIKDGKPKRVRLTHEVKFEIE